MSRRSFAPRSLRGVGMSPFPLPPALAKLPADRSRLAREFVEQELRNRVLLAALDVFGTKGFAAATVQDLLVASPVSRSTFYRLFADQEACFLALQGEVLDWLEEEARDAAQVAKDWPGAVVAVGRRLVGSLIDDPRIARVCTVESLAGGPEIRACHDAAVAVLAAALERGRDERPWGEDLPRGLEQLLLRGALFLIAGSIASDRGSARTALVDEIPEVLLIPYLGREDARRAGGRA